MFWDSDCISPWKQCVHYCSLPAPLYKTKMFNPQRNKRKYDTSKITPWILNFKRQNLVREPFEKYFPSCAFLLLRYSVQGSLQFHNSGEGSYGWGRSSERGEAQSYKDLGLLPSRMIQSCLGPNLFKILIRYIPRVKDMPKEGVRIWMRVVHQPPHFLVLSCITYIALLIVFKFFAGNAAP